MGRGCRGSHHYPTTTPPCLRAPPKRTGQGVVHVKAKALDLLQRQAPVDEDPEGDHAGSYGVRRGLGLGVAQRKRWGRVSLSQSLVSALGGLCAHPSPGPHSKLLELKNGLGSWKWSWRREGRWRMCSAGKGDSKPLFGPAPTPACLHETQGVSPFSI